MNAALLLMTSTIMAGADAAPVQPSPVTAPAAIAGPGCGPGGCGAAAYGPVAGGCCDACGSTRGSLFGHHKSRKSSDCDCKPSMCSDYGTCGRQSLFGNLKGKFGKHHGGKCDGCDAGCGGCGAAGYPAGPTGCAAPLPAGAAPVVAPTTEPPKEMPAPTPPKTTPPTKKEAGSGTSAGGAPSISIPSPGAVVIPSTPITPVSGPKLIGSTSPY